MEEKKKQTEPEACKVAKKCGGCQYQGVPYKEQLKKKQKMVNALLSKYGKVEPIIGMENPYYYRNKVHAVFDRDRKGNIVSGTYEAKTHRVVPVENCLIEDKKSQEIIRTIRGLLKSFKIKTYDEDTGYGLFRHVLIRRGFKSGEIMVVLVLGSPILPSRLKELREKNGCTMDDMAKKIDVLEGLKPGTGMNKSSISRVEGGKTAEKTLLEMARKYCKVFGMSESQTEQFLRGEKVAVPDTSALLKNSQLIDELNKEYSKVVIPKVVVDELDNIKNKNSGSLGRKAWEVIRGISYGSRTILMEYNGDADEDNEDCKIIYIAQEASDTYHCKIDIITEDTDYSAYLKGHESVSALHLREYMATKQDLINMTKLARIDAYYADSYEECEEPTADEVNAYLQDGNTLIISAVRNNRATIEQRKEKIKWLIQLGADVNKRDCSRRYFPALSHAVQMKDYEMFMFLLLECKANPNVGSRNPFDAGKVRQKNEGNMPLMIAAWEGKKDFVIALCEDERTSINQQDANGFTALMKACMNGHFENNKEKHTWDIRKILIDAGADQKIVDIDGKTAADWVSEYHESGPTRKQFNRGNNTNSQKRGNRRW